MMKKIVVRLLVIAAAIALLSMSLSWISSGATKYCPISHKLNPDFACTIRDAAHIKTLIEHFNLDTNELSLSMHEGNIETWVEHPHETVKSFSGQLHLNTIKFNASDSNTLLVNGESFQIKPRSQAQ